MSRGAGDRTLGEYELLSLLGRGAAGEVFLARRSGDQAAVAVKVLHDGDPRALERFRREADVLARLRHPSIVSVLAHGAAAGRPYLVLEYCAIGASWRRSC